MFLIKDGDKVEWTSVKEILTKVNMVTTFDIFVAVCGKVLDEDFSRYYINQPRTELVEKVLQEIENVELYAEDEYSGFTRFLKKTQRLFYRKWMYDSGLLSDSFWKEIVWNSMRDHIKKPKYL